MNEEAYIVHCTRKVESLLSILENGFLLRRNETKVWDELFKGIGKNIADINTGMICFTAIPVGQDLDTCSPLKDFGPFGIVVDNNWGLDNGMKPVVYIDKKSVVFESLKTILEECIHKPHLKIFLGNKLVDVKDNHTEKMYEEIVLNSPFLPSSYTNPLYSHLLEFLSWVETSDHQNENEYRIRSKWRPVVPEGTSKNDAIKDGLCYKKAGFPVTDFLQIEPASVLSFICPKSQECELKTVLQETRFLNVKIIVY